MNSRITLMLLGLLLLSQPAIAQPTTPAAPPETVRDTSWTNSATFGVNFSQVGLSNWSGGGQNTIAVIGLFSGTANYLRERVSWNNALELGYGITKLGKQEFRKSDDKIILISKFGYALIGAGVRSEMGLGADGQPIKADVKVGDAVSSLGIGAVVDFRTQFTEGFTYDDALGTRTRISSLFAPAYLTGGIGADYKPAEYFSLFVSPLSARFVFVGDKELADMGAFGVEAGQSVRSEFGASLSSLFKRDLIANVNLQSRLALFMAYRSPLAVVVNSETLLVLKVNDYINASVGFDIFYDDKIFITRDDGSVGPATQFRNTIAVGFSYTFKN